MSGLLFHDKAPTSPAAAFEGFDAPSALKTGFFENIAAGFRSQVLSDNASSRRTNLFDAYQPIIEALNADGSRAFENPYGHRLNLNAPSPARAGFDEEAELARIWREVDRRRQADPQAAGGLPGSRQALEAQVRERVLQARRDFADISDRSGTAGMVGGFLGQMGGAVIDPPNLAALAVGAPAAAGILRTAMVEALLGGGTEAAIQPSVARYYEELGIDYTAADFLANVGMAAAGAGLFAGGAQAAIVTVRRVFAKRAAGEEVPPAELAEAAEAVPHLPEGELGRIADEYAMTAAPDNRAAADGLTTLADVDAPLPEGASDAVRAAHRRQIEVSQQALETGGPLPEPPPLLATQPMRETTPSTLEELDPARIEVDAKTFQFKEGGDAAGVTERLQGVTRWDPLKAGVVMVYEYADGRQVVADGHQRVGLARRLAAENPDQNIRIDARVVREVDGITPDEARVEAAAINIAQGTGSAVDAARIFRAAPGRLDGTLSRRSALVQHGIALSNLNDEAFGLVSNGLVREDFGALVGRLAPDDAALQTGLMRALHHMDPANQAEAEAIIRQFISLRGDDEAIADLFGEQALATSLMRERARLVDRVQKALRKDKQIFGTLSRNADEIEAAGNVLGEGNARRADLAAQTADIIQRLANRTGPVAEAFNAGAAKAKEQGRYDEAVRDVVEAVRGAVARGDLEGLLGGGTGRTLAAEEADAIPLFGNRAAGQSARQSEAAIDDTLNGFSDPESAQVAQQAEALRIDAEALPDSASVDLLAGLDDAGGEVIERVSKRGLLDRQAKETDFLEQLQVVCRS